MSLPAKRSRDQHCASDGSGEETAAAHHSPSKRPFLGTVAPPQPPPAPRSPSPPAAGLDAELLQLASVAAAEARLNQQQQSDRTTAGNNSTASRQLVDPTAGDATPDDDEYDDQAAAYAGTQAADALRPCRVAHAMQMRCAAPCMGTLE